MNTWYSPAVRLALAAVLTLPACTDDRPLTAPIQAPEPSFAVGSAQATATTVNLESEAATAGSANFRAPNLAGCQNLQPPAGSKLVFRAYARGVQIYHWNGDSWIFDGPSAVLFADAAGKSRVGTHSAGPIWESASGSSVIGAVLQRCTPDPDAIPWLLLGAESTEGPGVFHRVAYIQRLNTVGGNAPSVPGGFAGEEARVPYTTEYFFYRAH